MKVGREIPLQSNSDDCRVFKCQYAKSLCLYIEDIHTTEATTVTEDGYCNTEDGYGNTEDGFLFLSTDTTSRSNLQE